MASWIIDHVISNFFLVGKTPRFSKHASCLIAYTNFSWLVLHLPQFSLRDQNQWLKRYFWLNGWQYNMLVKCDGMCMRARARHLEPCVGTTLFVKEQQGNVACVWENPSWANNRLCVCVQQVVWWRLQPPASGGYVNIDMLWCLQGAWVAWNLPAFWRTGKWTTARKYWQEQPWDEWQYIPLHCTDMTAASWVESEQE